ncbi:uncharacterized protein VTP21DRAFT_2995 [Calcarisporiella thermophila]|uniref:uncharacterized protein n=1 Tax=Calcarisporiella thermophila TaxID=911321 RepID=UPI00374327FD
MPSLSLFSKEDIFPVPDTPYFLTPFHPSDKEAMIQAMNDPLIFEFTGIPTPFTPDDADHYISYLPNLPDRHVFAIRTSEGDYIGTINIDQLSPERAKVSEVEEGTWQVGFLLAKEWRGKGVLNPALRFILEEFAFKREKLESIYGFASVGNWASRRNMEKVGFEFLGEVGNPIPKPNKPGISVKLWKFIKRRDHK